MKTILSYRARLSVIGLLWVLVQSAVAQNFTLTLEPDSLTLVPGQTASFVVSITPLAGFTNNVTLSTGALPTGITAAFSPNPVKPPGTSLLTLTATTNAAVGSFTVNISGVGGGITNTTTSSVTVNFGLLPLCTGGFTGVVTDEQTGLPVPGAIVLAIYNFQYSTIASANGVFNFTNVALAANNIAAQYSLQASASGYWALPYVQSYAVCDATNIVNLQILRQQYASVSGHVSIQGGGAAAGVTVSIQGQSFTNIVTDASGNFSTATALTLGYTNSPTGYSVTSQAVGDWQASTNVVVQANSNTVANLVLVPICYSSVTGHVVYADTLLPATNAGVTVNGGQGSVFTNTDANGNYVLNHFALNFDNAPLNTSIFASAPGYNTSFTNLSVSDCGVTAGAPVIFLIPVPKNNFGAVSGHVYDVQTGLPLNHATISGTTFTDTNGAYLYTNIFVGSGPNTNITVGISAIDTGYFSSVSNVQVFAGLTNTQDFRLLKIGFGEITGIARDSATTLPLTNIFINISGVGSVLTDSNGNYSSGPVPLNPGNVPTAVSIFTSPTGYYQYVTNTTVTNGVTNIVNLDIIKVCTGATIVGNVVNALNQQPITNATIFVSGFPAKTTDTNGNFILTNITVGNLNSPIQVTVNASAPGFNPQSHNVTIFCNATITTEFGAPQTAFGTIQGLVTNAVTGVPLVGAFIGSEFGEATLTDSNGFYQLTQAPLGANSSPRTWNITAIPTNFTSQTLPETVAANVVSTLNFGFGQPPAHLLVTETSAPNPVVVGSNLVYLITLNNSGADAQNVQLTDRLAPTLTFVNASITNPPGGSFTSPVFSNGVITTTGTNLASDQSLFLVVTVVPTVPGLLTNITTVTSTTPDTDPTGTNLTAMVVNTATAPIVPQADLALTMTVLPNPVVVSNQLAYSLFLTNLGPADAPGVVLDTVLPAFTTFLSASNSQGTFTQNGTALHWDIGTIANQGGAQAGFVIMPLTARSITNFATVAIGAQGGGVTDPNPANNSASAVVTVTAPVLLNVSVQALGNPVFNPQTGLFEQTVQFHNLSTNTATGVRVSILGLPAKVTLYNASGSANGVPYVEYDLSVVAGGTVNFALEYYDITRTSFVSTNFTATAVEATTPTSPPGTVLQLDQMPVLHKGQLLIEFASIPGKTYVIQYSSNMLAGSWQTAVPPIVAAGTKVQWIDAGPPKTASPPGNVGQRFYQVLQIGGTSTNLP